jgi:acylaminoacyl-peptidase
MFHAKIRPRVLGLAALSLAALPAQRRPFSPADLREWREASEVRIAPDGKSAVYVESAPEPNHASVVSNLWIASTDGRARRPLTAGAWMDWSPRWAAEAPEGAARIAYLSNRGGRAQIRFHLLAGPEDGPDTQVGDMAQPPLAIAISPRGDTIAFTAMVPRKVSAPWAPAAILPFLRPSLEGHVQLFAIPVSGGAPRQLTTGDLNWMGEPAWMPDGQSILCAAEGDPDADHPLQGGAIFSVRVADGAMKQLSETEGLDRQPTPSPDGSRIAWLSSRTSAQSYNVRQLYVMNPDGSRVKQLTGAFDRDVSRPQWSSDSRTVYFLAEDAGAAHVYAARGDGSVRAVTKGAERLRDFSLADNGRAACIRASGREAGDVISFATDLPGGVTTLYSPNEHLLAEREIAAVEEMRYDSAGHSIQSWLVMPPGFDPSRKYPLLLDLSESPRTMNGVEFQLRAQVFAAAGFVVLLANPRGTPGYGEQFGNLLPTRNPGDDAGDLLRGVEAAVAKGFIDGKRLMLSGGLTAAWILGHSDRFAAAVLRDPIADRAAEMALAQDGLRRAAAEMGAMPWADPAQYWQHSPLYFAGGFKTPTLILSCAGDSQGRELYFALQARKVDSALIELPPDGYAVDALETELGWLKLR